MNAQIKETAAPHKPSLDPYARYFPRRERTRVAAEHADDLSAEVTLLRLLIGRQLSQPPSETLQDGGATFRPDVRQVCTFLETLCRALALHHSLSKTGRDDLDEALVRVLTELNQETEAGQTFPSPFDPAPAPVARASPPAADPAGASQ